jgi:hypothetical protein
MKRICFLSHFTLCLAVAAGAFVAFRAGALEAVWIADKSRMTSAIGALLMLTLTVLGVQAWRVDDGAAISLLSGKRWDARRERWLAPADASFGHLAERLAVIFGFVGTAVGLSLQAKALAAGGASFDALATSLFTTACGGAAAAIIAAATYSLEAGMRRGE